MHEEGGRDVSVNFQRLKSLLKKCNKLSIDGHK